MEAVKAKGEDASKKWMDSVTKELTSLQTEAGKDMQAEKDLSRPGSSRRKASGSLQEESDSGASTSSESRSPARTSDSKPALRRGRSSNNLGKRRVTRLLDFHGCLNSRIPDELCGRNVGA